MKDYLRQIVGEAPDPLKARSLTREYVQTRMLQMLQDAGAFRRWIFRGGTALRFLYALPRYSEDLDFSLANIQSDPGFDSLLGSVRRGFEAESYIVEAKPRRQAAVWSVFVRFKGLLFELDLSPRRTEILSVKIELDTRPPSGGGTETSLFRRFDSLLNLKHYDKATLLSGKLHALLCRPYPKGRDLYDLFWYLSDRSWPEPNIPFLAAALRRTKWEGPKVGSDNWKSVIADKLDHMNWKRAVNDVRPFLDRPAELDHMTKENVMLLLLSRAEYK